MFGNFIYFIIALLIYLTYQPSGETNFSLFETICLFLSLIIGYTCLIKFQFQRIERRISEDAFIHLDQRFNSVLNRHYIIALIVFSIDIFGLNLPTFCSKLPLFAVLPTLQAIVFLGLFVCYLVILWVYAYSTYRKLYTPEVSGRDYVLSHISFSIPVLLPWVLLSGFADIIRLLPFDVPKHFLSTPEGEIAYFLIFMLAVCIAGPLLIQKFWRCKPLEDSYERRRIEHLCQRAGIEYADILYWPIFGGRMITAGVMGLIKSFRYILVTDALFKHLNPEEIDSVIAHEIGHVKKRHLLFYLFFFGGYLLFFYASYAVLNTLIYILIYTDPFHQLIRLLGFSESLMFSVGSNLMIIIIFVIYFRFVFGYFIRNFERQADVYVYSLFESASPLISTFEKITLTTGQSPDKPNWHHFSVTERMEYLKKCEQDRSWIVRHDEKIKKSILCYLAGIILISGIGYYLNFGEIGKQLTLHLFEQLKSKEPNNPNLYRLLGDIYYSAKNYEQTIESYETSLTLNPDNPHVLNNLAWLYATCEDHQFRDSERAVMLAERAAELLTESFVLDTLAESYYANGQYEKAVSTEHHALQIATDNHAYYEEQLKKFMKAATRDKV